jgi:hypothetical protein
MVNTGRKLITVVLIAVSTAEPTSPGAAKDHLDARLVRSASSRCLSTFSVTMTPMSTMVPMAMAMPASATTFASTPNSFMRMKPMSTASGSMR